MCKDDAISQKNLYDSIKDHSGFINRYNSFLNDLSPFDKQVIEVIWKEGKSIRETADFLEVKIAKVLKVVLCMTFNDEIDELNSFVEYECFSLKKPKMLKW